MNDSSTPAPLDPSKVAITLKAGDYIEAESDGAKIGGKVSHVNENGFVAIEHVGTFAIHHITASPVPGGYRMFVLTAHQPAPEPEPEWKPGVVHAARLLDSDVFHVWAIEGDVPGVTAEFTDHLGNSYEPRELHDVRPLVVIDPAAVDMEALARRFDLSPNSVRIVMAALVGAS